MGPGRPPPPAPRDAGPCASPRPAHAAPVRRGARRGGVVRRRGAGGDADPRRGVRVAAHRPHVAALVPGRRRHHLRALRRRLAQPPQGVHPGAPHRPPRPVLPPRARGRAPPPARLRRRRRRRRLVGDGDDRRQPDGEDIDLHRRLHGARHHRQPTPQGPRRVPPDAQGPLRHHARDEPAGPLPVLAPRHAPQPRSCPDPGLPPQHATDHGWHHRRAPGQGSRRRCRRRCRRRGRGRGLRRRAPQTSEGSRLPVPAHNREHQNRHAGHIWREHGDVDDDAGLGDGGAPAEPEGDGEGAARGPASVRRPRHGDRGQPSRPALPEARHQGVAAAAPAGDDAGATAVPERVPGARVRRAGGHDGDRERVGDRQGPGALGRTGRVLAGEVRAERQQGLQGRRLRVHTVRCRAADLPRHDVRAGSHRARARGVAVPLRLELAGWACGRGAGHDRGIWDRCATAFRPFGGANPSCPTAHQVTYILNHRSP